jgi:hypothetical protein
MAQKKQLSVMIVDDDAFLLDMYALKFTKIISPLSQLLGLCKPLKSFKEGRSRM